MSSLQELQAIAKVEHELRQEYSNDIGIIASNKINMTFEQFAIGRLVRQNQQLAAERKKEQSAFELLQKTVEELSKQVKQATGTQQATPSKPSGTNMYTTQQAFSNANKPIGGTASGQQ